MSLVAKSASLLWLVAIVSYCTVVAAFAATAPLSPLETLYRSKPSPLVKDDAILFFEPFDRLDDEDGIELVGDHGSNSLSKSLPNPSVDDDSDEDGGEDRRRATPSLTPSHTPSLPITGLDHLEDTNASAAMSVYSGMWAFPRNILYNKVARLTEEVVKEQRDLLESGAAEYHRIEQIKDPVQRTLKLSKLADNKRKRMSKKAATIRDRERLEKYYGDWGVRSLGVFSVDNEIDRSLRTGGSGSDANSALLPNTHRSRHYVAVTRAPPSPSPSQPKADASSTFGRRTVDELEAIFMEGLQEVQSNNAPTPTPALTTSTIPKHRVLREVALSFNFKSEQISESAYTADKVLYARDDKEERDGFRRQLRSEGGKHYSHTEEDEITRRQHSNDVLMRKKRDQRRRERRSARSNSDDERLPYDDFERNHKFCGEGHLRVVPSLARMADAIAFPAASKKPLGDLFDLVGQTSLLRRSRRAGVLADRLDDAVKATLRHQKGSTATDDEDEGASSSVGAPTRAATSNFSDPLEHLNISHLSLLLEGSNTGGCGGVLYPFSSTDAQGYRVVKRRQPNKQLVGRGGERTPSSSASQRLLFTSSSHQSKEVGPAPTEPEVVEEKFSHNHPFLLKFGPRICNGRFELGMAMGRFVPYYYFPKSNIEEDPLLSSPSQDRLAYIDLRQHLYQNTTLIDAFVAGSTPTALPQGATMAWSAAPSARSHPIRIGSHPYTQTFTIRIVEEVVPPMSSLDHHPLRKEGTSAIPTVSVSESFLDMDWSADGRRLTRSDDAFALVEDANVKLERSLRVAAAMERDGVVPFVDQTVGSSLDGEDSVVRSCSGSAALGIADGAESHLHQKDLPQGHITHLSNRADQLPGIYTEHGGWLRSPGERLKAGASLQESRPRPSMSPTEWQSAIDSAKSSGSSLQEQHLAVRHVVEVYVEGALVADDVLEHEFPEMLNLNTRREFMSHLNEKGSSNQHSYIDPSHTHFNLDVFVRAMAHVGFDVSQNRPGSLFDNVIIGTDLDAVMELTRGAKEGRVVEKPAHRLGHYLAPTPIVGGSPLPKATREVKAAVQLKLSEEARVGNYLSEKGIPTVTAADGDKNGRKK